MPASTQPSTRGRRENHEGTIYQITRGPRAGEWRAQISLPGGERRSFSGRTEEIVKQKLLDARFKQSHGLLAPARGELFEEYAKNWLGARRHELRYNSLRAYQLNLEKHVYPIIGSMALVDIKRRDVKRVHTALLDSGHSPKTVQLVHGIVAAILRQAEEDELIPLGSTPAKVRLPKVAPPNFVPLDPTEIHALIEAMRGDPLEALFLLTVTCGLRRGEVCGIRWSDLDLNHATLQLRGQIVREPKGKLVFSPLKTATGSRLVIDLAPPVVDALLVHKDRQTFAKTQAAELWKEQDYVFTNAIGDSLDPMQAYRMFKLLLKRAGLRDQRFHDLRHAAASLLLSWGLELWQVSKLLRHSGLSITSDVYGHLYQQTGKELAEKMGAFIQQARMGTQEAR